MSDADPKPKKRMGRPPKPAAEVKRRGIAFRVNDKLYAHIQESAQANQRSIAEEVEYRLQIASDVAPILDAMIVDRPTKELFRTLARSIKAVRSVARKQKFDEVRTRKAIKSAFSYISDINFWTGEEIETPEGYIRDESEPSKKSHERDPNVIGYTIASDGMFWESAWDACVLRDDYPDAISNHWSGDGRVSVDVEARQGDAPSRSLEDIMAEVNPRDRSERRK